MKLQKLNIEDIMITFIINLELTIVVIKLRNIRSLKFSVKKYLFYITEIARIQRGGKPPGRDTRIVDIYHEKPIRLTVRVIVPVKEHPKFNFVGKLLGPKGNSMKRLQEDTMTKMAVLGKGSMRNKQQVT